MSALASATDARLQSSGLVRKGTKNGTEQPQFSVDDDGSLAKGASHSAARRSSWIARRPSAPCVELPPTRQRWEQVLAQIRIHCREDAFRVWEVVGTEEAGDPARPVSASMRFASPADRVLLNVMRCIAILDALWVPVLLAYGRLEWPAGPFARGGLAQPLGHSPAAKHLCLIETFLFLLYALGLGMRFNTSVVSLRMGKEFLGLGSILALQLSDPFFWIDCVSLAGSLWWAAGSRWWAALRLLRLWRLPSSAYRTYEITLGHARVGFAAACAELFGAVWLGAHFFGCLWFYTVSFQFSTWEELHEQNPTAMPSNTLHAYVQCWGEGVSLLVGWNAPTPSSEDGRFTVWEMLYCILVGPSASMFLAYTFAKLLKALDQAEESQSRFNEQMSRVEGMLASLETPPDLKQRVLQYYAFMGVHNLDKSTYEMLFQGLSWNLHVELKLFLFEQLVLNAPFFQQLPPLMVMDMVRSFELLVFSPGDIIVKKGQVGSEMYFVVKGGVDIMVDDDATVKVAEKSVGDYFGEVALVLDEARTAWVITNKYCVLAKLTKDAFQEFTRNAPEVRADMLERIAQMRLKAPAPAPAARPPRPQTSPRREPGPPSHREDMPLLK